MLLENMLHQAVDGSDANIKEKTWLLPLHRVACKSDISIGQIALPKLGVSQLS